MRFVKMQHKQNFALRIIIYSQIGVPRGLKVAIIFSQRRKKYYSNVEGGKKMNLKPTLQFDFTLRAAYLSYSQCTVSGNHDHLVIEYFRTTLRKFSPSISGKYFWMNIPSCISQKPPKKQSKCALTSYDYAAQC